MSPNVHIINIKHENMITRIFVSFFILASIGINITAKGYEKYFIKTGTVIDTLYFETINILNRLDSVKEYSVLYLEFLKIGPKGEIIYLNSVDDLDDLYVQPSAIAGRP